MARGLLVVHHHLSLLPLNPRAQRNDIYAQDFECELVKIPECFIAFSEFFNSKGMEFLSDAVMNQTESKLSLLAQVADSAEQRAKGAYGAISRGE